MEQIKFYKTKEGKILVSLVDNEKLEEGLKELKAGEVDAAKEKHVPSIKKEDGKIIVDVGSIPHPMMEVHYIQFIALVSKERGLEVKTLKPTDAPRAEFKEVSSGEVYEYCNLHGLWKASF